ncbi:MAG: thioredoxin domain-containing protein [Myxococcota bacterium]|nr:thioredoxin domain-containing protein [Myxococcota bacterium]
MNKHTYRCSHCGGLNQVPASRVAEGPRCGRCKTPLSLDNPPFDVDDAGLAKLVRQSPVPVLVDFWAPWCGPCRTVAPHLVELGKRKAGRMLIAKVNTQNHPHTAAAMQVQAIPTLAIWKGGQVVERQPGARMGLQLDQLVDPHIL